VTRRVIGGSIAAAVIVGGAQAASAPQATHDPATRRQFVACPVVRDTRTQPCWLAEYEGELYYLGQQGGVANDFYPPQLGHLALVEGIVGQGRVCGGIPLQPVKVSVMRELTPACRTMLPAEDGIEAPPPVPSPRGPAPSWVKADDPRNVALYFDFDSDFFSLHVTVALTNIAKLVADANLSPNPPNPSPNLSRVEVTGFTAATRLSNGTLLTERDAMGATRARKVADTLVGLGVRADRVTVLPARTLPADGVNDPWNRRVEVRVR
jgi:outer membrane protein OmpA-like peptidoglycan-associated protein